jgi:BON domain-containing protein
MNKGLAMLGTLGLGAGLMYLLDRDRGRRRRAMMRDKAIHALSESRRSMKITARDFRNRVRGLSAGARTLINQTLVSDEVLVERVRSKMGRVVSHPHSISVSAYDGRVTLSGPILTNEVNKLIVCASSIPGVTGVENMLEPHEEAGDVRGLQGGHPRRERSEFMQENWSPTVRVIAGATGGALLLYGAKHPKVLGAAAGVLGAGLIARSVTNTEMIRGARNR